MSENIDYDALFGLDDNEAMNAGAAAPGSEVQGPADPAENTEGNEPAPDGEAAEGENAQDPAAPAQALSADAENAGTADEEGGQTPEDNAKYAAARRKAEAERDAEIARIRAEVDREKDEFYASIGLINPYTQKQITSRAEYEEYQKQYSEDKKSSLMRKSGMSEEEFGRFVQNLPEVREAAEVKAQASQALMEARKAEADAKVAEQIKEINALDPSIKTLEDLTRTPNYDRLYQMVRDNGLSIVDAFKLVNYDALRQGAAAGARQAAMNAMQGKQHLGQTQQRGQGAVSVPADVMAQYRMFNPDATDAEIRAHYAKTHKQ